MKIENKEILCIPGREKNYAIEYLHILELSSNVKISRFPCLPSFFLGVINYKGNIIPIVTLEELERSVTGGLALIVKEQNHIMGILLSSEPYIIRRKEAERIELYPETENKSFWKEKGGLKKGNEVFRIIDVEKTIEGLSDFLQYEL